jgi:tRNA pseudouridine38-40 synthase
MSARLKIAVAYDGASFGGWQSQSHANTIQDLLESAFERIFPQHLRVHGAGRTDAGVHALGQCAHVDLPHRRLETGELRRALNSLLPPAIRVLRCCYVAESFHARYSATRKLYRYRLWLAEILPPFESGRVWHLPDSVDLSTVRTAAAQFVGTHDFAGFAANRGKTDCDTVRTIYSVCVRQRGPLVTIDFDGSGFLYKMVRLIVGTIVQSGRGKIPLSAASEDLFSPRFRRTRLAAPAHGLILVRVRY